MSPLPSDGYICYLVTEHLKKILSESTNTKLSLFNFFVLQYVDKCSEQDSTECTQYMISQAFLADTSKVNKAVRELESAELLTATKIKQSGRIKKILAVTPPGKKLIEIHRAKTDAIAEQYLTAVHGRVNADELFEAHNTTMAAFYDALKLYKNAC